MRIVWPPHVDYLRAVAGGAPDGHGFIPYQGRWWRPGWWAAEKTVAATQGGGVRTIADAEAVARSWPQPWTDAFHLTRVDVACDVVCTRAPGVPEEVAASGFTSDMRHLFTGRGAKQVVEKRHELRTLYIGGRESPIMLRIYLKSAHCTERDRQQWLCHGWNGRDDVWRIEYEFHRRALPAGLELPRDTMLLWADGLARIRMCAVNPRQYAEQNRAPLHPWWAALGRPHRLTRRAVDMAGRPAEDHVRDIMRTLDRMAVKGGALLLPEMLARLARHIPVVSNKRSKHNGKG